MARRVAAAQNGEVAPPLSALGTTPPEASEKSGPSPLVRDHLFAARTVLLFGEVTTALAESVSAQLLALAERSSEPIRIVIHSQGGHVEAE
jgi:ATP-dependent protease ClpP protease subunit